MASLNKVFILGGLSKAPELRYTTSGQAVASFSVATTEKFKQKDGSYNEKTEWHRVTLWGRQAEVAGEFLDKGSVVLIEGRIQTRKWTDRDGNEKYTTEIVGDHMQMVGGKGAKNAVGGEASDDSSGNTPESTPEPPDLPF